MEYSIYWIRLAEHTDMFTQGYIGISKCAEKRWDQHCKRPGNRHLKFAINKYGWTNILKSKIVVGEKDYCLNIEKQLRLSDDIGWNITSGGGLPPISKKGQGKGHTAWNKGIPCSEETKKKISESTTIQMQDPDRREINRQAMLGKPSCMLGKHHTDEAKEKIGAAHLGVPSKRKGVLMTKEQRQRLCDLMQQKPKWICPHCGKTGLHLGAANKWHFDKCRSKKEK